MDCRLCGAPLIRTFVDLGASPLCESYLTEEQLDAPETTYPLHVRTCTNCLLVQLPECVGASGIFSDYAYFSSYSDSWVKHAHGYVARMSEQLALGPESFVVEVASNDGYLLQHLVARGVPILGIEPAGNVAEVARARGIRTEVAFLGADTGARIAREHRPADLVVANNVFAHVPDLLDFVRGLRAILAANGLLTLEFPHLLRLIEGRQYDTIYHEHFSYFSLLTAMRALETGGLKVTDVEQLPTHGGSLRVHARRAESVAEVAPAVAALLEVEQAAGLHTASGHDGFATAVLDVKRDLLEFLIDASRDGRRVAGYGAPGKGNTLLNHCGIRRDLVPYTVDRSPHKQGRFLPGTRIPILAPDRIAEDRPDFVLVLPWNLRHEITDQLSYIRDWGGRLVFPIPKLEIV
ncbi:MAG: class I SAM-dependent methyltransferase [Pseudonocardiales bacterium]